MNKSQAHSLQAYLSSKGHQKVNDIRNADFVCIFTCSVRSTAERRALGRLGYFKYIKQTVNNFLGIVILGCMSEEYWELFLKDDYADIVVGTKKQEDIEAALHRYYDDQKKTIVGVKALQSSGMSFLKSAPDEEYPFRAYVSIIHGCSNFCSYCVVPYLRGAEISRNSEEIIDDIKRLSELGVKEIFLLGQNVNAYGKDNGDITFPQLLNKIVKIKGLEYITFLSPHPKDFTPELIQIIADNPVIGRNIHLPLQSGSDKILDIMNRGYSVAEYLKVLELIRKKIPDVQLSTDIIVGFSNENHDDYLKTLQIIKDVEFADAFMYKFTKRKLVLSALEDNVTESIKLSRLDELINVQSKIAVKIRKNQIAKNKKVIIINHSRREITKMLFRSHDGFFGVVNSDYLVPGDICYTEIIDIIGKTLIGVVK